MRIQTLLLILFTLTAPLMSGFTACKYWTDTTVPASDSTVPIAAPSVILGGDPQIIRFGSLFETVHDLNMNIIVIPSIWDSGGTRSISMGSFAEVLCNDGSGLSLHFIPQSETQAGSTGSTVSQGIYLLQTFRFANLGSCSGNGGVQESNFFFSFSGSDFFGNTASGSGTIRYTP